MVRSLADRTFQPRSARSAPLRPGSARSRPGSARSARYPDTNFSSLFSKDELSREAAAEQGAELAAEALLEKFQDQADAEGVQLFAAVRLPEDAYGTSPEYGSPPPEYGTPPLGPKLVTSTQQSVPQVGLIF